MKWSHRARPTRHGSRISSQHGFQINTPSTLRRQRSIEHSLPPAYAINNERGRGGQYQASSSTAANCSGFMVTSLLNDSWISETSRHLRWTTSLHEGMVAYSSTTYHSAMQALFERMLRIPVYLEMAWPCRDRTTIQKKLVGNNLEPFVCFYKPQTLKKSINCLRLQRLLFWKPPTEH